MDHTEMTIDEFEDLAFAHGADLGAWPGAAREKAAALLAASPEAQAALTQARSLEAALATVRPADPEPSVELMSRILADAAAATPAPRTAETEVQPKESSLLGRLQAFLSPAAACAASAALGLWLGYAGPVDFSDVAVEALGVETEMEFALLDGVGASPIAGVIDILEGSE